MEVPADNPKVTWYELSLSFMLDTGYFLPLKRQVRGLDRLLPFATVDCALEHQATFGEISHWFPVLVKQVRDLQRPDPWPLVPKGVCKSLYHLGNTGQNNGFLVRPELPCQQLVVNTLREYLDRNAGSFQELPHVPVTPNTRAIFAETTRDCGEVKRLAQRSMSVVRAQHGQQRLAFR